METNYIKRTEEIQNLISDIKSEGDYFYTNYFNDERKTTFRIENRMVSYYRFKYTVFLIVNEKDFSRLYFITNSLNGLKDDIKLLLLTSKMLLVSDIVIIGKNIELIDAFVSNGFNISTTLVRMNKTPIPYHNDIYDISIMNAEKEDAPMILALLNSYFNPYEEQIPYSFEIDNFILDNKIIIYKVEDRIAGFIIYDSVGFTLYLRYWFVHPDFRNKGIGSKLFKEFEKRGEKAKRQIFWVIETNDNAIKRYKHYGFKEENFFNYVLIKDNLYERKNNIDLK